MVVRWTRVCPLEYVGTWQGMRLSLKWSTETRNWRVYVDGRLTKTAWCAPSAAMEYVETSIANVLRRAGVQAQPRDKDFYRVHYLLKQPLRVGSGACEN
jgi:hypothetical protein